jgi:zinc finger SWIM domain-containing protein 3
MELYETTKAGALLKIQNCMLCSAIGPCHKFLNLAYQVASFPECCILVDDALDCLSKRLQEKMSISASPSILCDSYSAQPQIPQDEDILSAARLKKKEVQQKNSKQH